MTELCNEIGKSSIDRYPGSGRCETYRSAKAEEAKNIGEKNLDKLYVGHLANNIALYKLIIVFSPVLLIFVVSR